MSQNVPNNPVDAALTSINPSVKRYSRYELLKWRVYNHSAPMKIRNLVGESIDENMFPYYNEDGGGGNWKGR